MEAATPETEIRPIPVPTSLGRFRVTFVFVLVSIAAMVVAAIAVQRVAYDIGEDATVRTGTEIAALQAGLVGNAFANVITSFGIIENPDSILNPGSITSLFQSGQMDATAAALLLMGTGDIERLLASNDIRHMSLHTVDDHEIWEAGDEVIGPFTNQSSLAIESNVPVSELYRGLEIEPELGDGSYEVIDALVTFVPIDVGGGPESRLVVDVVLDVTDTLEVGIAETEFAIRKGTLIVLGSILTVMTLVVFVGDLRMSNKSAQLIERERVTTRQLDDENRELQRIDQAKNEFLSSISHELKTPLAAVLGFTRIIKGNKKKNLVESDINTLQTIERNGWRLNSLIDDLLDLSRIESKRIRLQTESVNLRSVLDEVARTFEPIMDNRDQKLTLQLHEDPAWLDADRGRLIQILTNIVSNAGKYSDPGTEIVLRSEIRNGVAVLSVTDRGRGIKPDDLEQLFSLFFRTEDAEQSSTPGTGIGLYITKKIVELHRGSIFVESVFGSGTTVTVRLPGVSAEGEAERPHAPRFANRLENLPDPEMENGA